MYTQPITDPEYITLVLKEVFLKQFNKPGHVLLHRGRPLGIIVKAAVSDRFADMEIDLQDTPGCVVIKSTTITEYTVKESEQCPTHI